MMCHVVITVLCLMLNLTEGKLIILEFSLSLNSNFRFWSNRNEWNSWVFYYSACHNPWTNYRCSHTSWMIACGGDYTQFHKLIAARNVLDASVTLVSETWCRDDHDLVSYTELVACPKGTHTTECSPNKSVKDRHNERSDWSIFSQEFLAKILASSPESKWRTSMCTIAVCQTIYWNENNSIV